MDMHVEHNNSGHASQVQYITRIESVAEVKGLPTGSAVGDTFGGRTFSDNIAAALERRSVGGWREVNGWTVIIVEH